MSRLLFVVCTAMIYMLLGTSIWAQTGITTINISTDTGTPVTTLVTAPSDAGNSINPNTQYNINYGQGNNVRVTSYVVSGTTYDRFLSPDTLILNRRIANDRLVNIWYQLNQINTAPTPDELDIDPDIVPEADAIYLSGNLNAGYDNILVNDDDLASGSIQVETERVDVLWFSGIQTSDPTTSVFPIIERGGNDNISIAAITSLNPDGTPATYGTLVGVASTDWPGTGQTFSQYLILRRQAVGDDPIPLIEIGTQTVQGVAVSFSELGISAGQSIFGYSLFASDVEGIGGAPNVATGVDLADISTFPTNTLSSVSGLDLVAGVSAAVASDDLLIETVGPGGFKDALATWLKANDGAFVSNGGAASTEGNSVGFWEDQSVGNHDFTTLVTAPTFRSTTSSINFNPSVDFINGTETGLQVPDNADYNVGGPYTRKSMNFALRTSSDITTRQQIFEQGGGGNGLGIYIEGGILYGAVWNRNNSGSTGAPWNNATPTSFISTSISTENEYIITLEFDGSTDFSGSVTIYLNGQSIGSLSSVGLLYNHGNDIGLGDIDGGSRYHNNTTAAGSFRGEISEFVYCNEPGSLPLSQRRRIESYLAIKYGITLDQSTPINYLNSDGTIVFNTTNNASIGGFLEYNNDIAGIARDDNSELDQPTSRSENAGSVVTISRGATIGNDDTWLIWGNDGAALTQTSALSSPNTIDQRLNRVWRVAERNEVQNTSVSFDLTGLGLSTNASDFSLLIANNSSGADFSNATVLTGGTFNGNTITFENVNLNDGEYFTLGTEFFFCTPGNYDDGAIIWLRADQGVTTATEGANVTLWQDQTAAGNNGNNLTAPVYRATSQLINDNPTVDFSTGTTGIALPTVNGINNDESISKKFTITFRTGDDITTQQVIYEQGGATRGLNLYIQAGVLHLSAWNQANDGVGSPWNTASAIATVNTSAIAMNTTYVVTFDYEGNDTSTGTVTGYLNGTSFGTPLTNIGRLYPHADGVGLGDENSASRYGDGSTSGAASFDGFISDFAYYNQPTSYLASDRNRIESSMALKYGVTLDQTSATNYTRSDGNTVWNATTNATYNNDIAGIGRDDAACLDQRQSQSENTGSIVKMGLGNIAATNADNPNMFDEDGDFLIWGNDGDLADQANANTTDVPAIVTERIERIWRVEDTGNVGSTSISFDLTGLGYGTSISDFQLIVSNSPTMASGNTTPAANYDVTDNTVTFTGINLTDGQYFTLGTVRTTPCGPGGVVNGLRFQLRADLGVTGSTSITQWADQSGNGFNATATTGPELLATDINFNPSIQFNGTDEEMLVTNGIFGTSTFNDVFVYIVNQTNTVQSSSVFFETMAAGERFNAHIPWTDNNIYYDYGLCCTTGRISANWGTTIGNYHFWTLGASTGTGTPSGTNKAIYRDGAILATNNQADGSTGNNNNLSVGSAGGNSFHAGNVAEMIVFTAVPTPLEKERVETYLAIKYGIFKNSADNGTTGSTDERDYFDSNGDVIWDFTNNTVYHNDVAGIGRDDNSCLNQRQSESANTDDILSIGLETLVASNALNLNTFTDDRDFLVWGNDDGATAQASANTVDVPSTIAERMTRIWRVQDNGSVGETELQFDLTGLGYSVADASDFSLLVGNTATMADASIITGGTLNGNILSFTGVDLTDGQFFTLGTAVVTCGPGGVNSNISLWLRADLEVFSDAGVTAASDGSNVIQWNDQSSPQENGSETNLGGANPLEPTLETNEINFNPVITFSDPNSSNDSYIETSGNSLPGGDMTLISVFRTGQAAGTQGDFVNSPALIGASETTSTLDYGLGMENGQLFLNANTSTSFDAETPATYNDNQPHFVSATRVQSSGAINLYVDSESVASGTGSTSLLNAPTSFGIGNHSDADTDAQFAGDIAESIVFASALTGNERARVETYLAIKYGLTRVVASLPAAEQDYLAADGGIIWDFDGQGPTYYNDIFGIGRDDLSCFEQTQSQSENSDALVTFNLPGGFNSDDSFILSGNDNAVVEQEGNPERPGGIASRLNREWRVQETGTVGSVEVTYDLADITGPLGVGTNNLNLLRLLVDDDGDFNSGVSIISPSSIDGTNNTATFTVDFTDGQYYTLGSTEVAALPITLLSFSATNDNNRQVRLDWVTAQEINNAFYTIQRSSNGIDFMDIGTTEGNGNSNSTLYYQFFDNKPLNGRSFYRLKQTDFNGEFELSEIVSVNFEKPEQMDYKVYPNPVALGETLRIAFNTGNVRNLQIEAVGTTGHVHTQSQIQLEKNQAFIEVSTRNFSRGLNLIRISDDRGETKVIKILVR